MKAAEEKLKAGEASLMKELLDEKLLIVGSSIEGIEVKVYELYEDL